LPHLFLSGIITELPKKLKERGETSMKIIGIQWHLDTGNHCSFKVTSVEQPFAPAGKWELPEAYADMIDSHDKIHPDAKVLALKTEDVRRLIEELWRHVESQAPPPPSADE